MEINLIRIVTGTFYFLFGISIGSFLNVCIFRIPRKLPVAAPHSMCPCCRHLLSPFDLTPVLSWLLLKGKCRHCHAPISTRYPAIELLTGILYLLCFLAYGMTLDSVILCLFFSSLIAAAGIDFEHTYIPDRIHLIILILALASFLSGSSEPWLSMVLGCLIPSGIMLAVSLLTKGGIGFGDIKLMAASGLLLGLEKNVLAFFLAYLTAGLFHAVPLLRGRISGKDEIPMAPYFAASLILSALFGAEIWSWYFRTLLHIGY